VAKYRRGKTQVLQYFFKQVQKELDDRADGKAVGVILQRLLSTDSSTQHDWQSHRLIDTWQSHRLASRPMLNCLLQLIGQTADCTKSSADGMHRINFS